MLSMLLIYLNSAFCLWVFVPYCITAVLRGGEISQKICYPATSPITCPKLGTPSFCKSYVFLNFTWCWCLGVYCCVHLHWISIYNCFREQLNIVSECGVFPLRFISGLVLCCALLVGLSLWNIPFLHSVYHFRW